MVDLLKAVQKLRRRARTSRESMNAKPVVLPPPQEVACDHSLLGELFPSIKSPMYYPKTWVFLRLILHTLFVRFRLCTGPTRLLLWFVKPQLAISDCLYQFLLVFSNRLQGLAFLARSSGFCARLITIGAVVL